MDVIVWETITSDQREVDELVRPEAISSKRNNGEMAERSKAHAWKACEGLRPPGVRIPLSPRIQNISLFGVLILFAERGVTVWGTVTWDSKSF